jgi:hypothetical protein
MKHSLLYHLFDFVSLLTFMPWLLKLHSNLYTFFLPLLDFSPFAVHGCIAHTFSDGLELKSFYIVDVKYAGPHTCLQCTMTRLQI